MLNNLVKVQEYLRLGVDVNSKVLGLTALHMAAQNPSPLGLEIMRTLLRDDSIDLYLATDRAGLTALMFSKNAEISGLLENGANPYSTL